MYFLLTFRIGKYIMILYGGAKVSTGTVRYNKRSGQDNPVKMSKLK